ncbi:MAG: DUF502 domain-containing protein [Dissulfurispiraceae bacterium]|nr:DUF502 domain-containing protein [Dissulfurispiraceae bacterium]
MKKLTKYFLEGLLFTVPFVVTIYVIYLIFSKIDNLFALSIPGAGFILTLAIITAVGFVASNLLTRRLLSIIDNTFSKLPLIKLLYNSLKDLIGAFVGDKKAFDKPVMVEIGSGTKVYVLGFVTCESLNNLGIIDKIAVYLPQSYNFAGNLIIVPREQITPLNTDSSNLMTFIVSGGITINK